VAAEFHFAEETFALHLLLQRLESLVDIIVADENLHAVFLFSSTIDRPNSQGALDHWHTVRHNSSADGTRGTKQRHLNRAADGHYGCQLEETGNSVRRRFLGSSSDEPVLAKYTYVCQILVCRR
jgi:hypothetical protein